MTPAPADHWPQRWKRFSALCVRGFHSYAGWLIGISWKRFILLALLLLVVSGLLQNIPPFSWTYTTTVRPLADQQATAPDAPSAPPAPPAPSAPPAPPAPPSSQAPGSSKLPSRADAGRSAAAQARQDAKRAVADARRATREVHVVSLGEFLPSLALLWIIGYPTLAGLSLLTHRL